MKTKELMFWIILFAIVAIAFFLDTNVHAKTHKNQPQLVATDSTQLQTIVVTAKRINMKLIEAFVNKMHDQYQFDKDELREKILSYEPLDTVLAQFRKQKCDDKKKNCKDKETPEEIAFRFERRVNHGVQFWAEHKEVIEYAQKKYGVLPETLVGLIGVETNYGGYTGNFNVYNTLVTLAFYGNHRAPYFQDELEHYLVTARNLNWNVDDIKGSFAGAIGIPQFMPSAVEPLWVSYKGTGIDIYNTDDAILSVANFLTNKGWLRDQPIATLTSRKEGKRTFVSRVLPGPYKTIWKKEPNYYNMYHYNPSDDYVMSIFILSQKIKERYQDHLETLQHTDELKLPPLEVSTPVVEPPAVEEAPTP
jgi:membrane-bound lytic murein transglycosylase B